MVSIVRRFASYPRFPAVARVLIASVGAATLTVLLVYLLMSLFVAGYPLLGRGDATAEQVAGVGWVVGTLATPAIFFALAFAGAYLAAKASSGPPRAVGLLVGLLAAVAALGIIQVSYAGVAVWEFPLYTIAGIVAGRAGAALALRVLGWQQALTRAAHLAGAVRDRSELPRATGLAFTSLGAAAAALWTFRDEDEADDDTANGSVDGARGRETSLDRDEAHRGRFRHAHAWSAEQPYRSDPRRSDTTSDSLSRVLDGAVARALPPGTGAVEDLDVTVVRQADVDPNERASWLDAGAKAVLVVPLKTSAQAPLGLLAVALRSSTPPVGMLGQAYSPFVTTASLALHNTFLVEQAQQAATLKERQRFQLDVHDTLAQSFTGIRHALGAIDEASSPEQTWDQIGIALEASRSGEQQARDLVEGATDLDATALPEVLRRLAASHASRTGPQVAFRTVGDPRPLGRAGEVALLRVAQEALNNAKKHSRARRVELVLTFADALATLQLADDGRGLEMSANAGIASGGRGLAGMRERMRSVGGSLFLGSTPGKGTRVLAHLPTEPPSTMPTG